MQAAIAPVWDGNETWLVLGGGGLFAAFPKAYAALMPALYLPIFLMLLALIFRGVAFEFRHHGRKRRQEMVDGSRSPPAPSSPPPRRASCSAASSRA
jgi:cytochrome d ubiquinol oxidase subunit II